MLLAKIKTANLNYHGIVNFFNLNFFGSKIEKNVELS